MKRRKPKSNPSTYWPALLHRGSYQYQYSRAYKVTLTLVSILFIWSIEPDIPFDWFHNLTHNVSAFIIWIISLVAVIQAVDYIFYRLSKK